MNTNKLPVFRTFGNALGFAVANYFTVLRLAWLPFTLLLAAQVALGSFVGLSLAKRIEMGPSGVLSHIPELVYLQVTLGLLQLIVIAAVAVSIHRVILFGDRRPGVWLSFRFGRTEFVYAIMAFLWGLMILAIIGSILLPALLLVSGGDLIGLFAQVKEWAKDWPAHAGDVAHNLTSNPIALVGFWFAYLIGWIIVLYVSLRLCVWPPSVVATNRLSPGEAWRLTDGNALRLLGLFVLTILVLYAVMAIVVLTVVFQFHDQLGHLPAPPRPEDMAAERARIAAWIGSNFAVYWPVFWLVALFVYSAVIGMTIGLISYSYKALKGYDAQAPIPAAE